MEPDSLRLLWNRSKTRRGFEPMEPSFGYRGITASRTNMDDDTLDIMGSVNMDGVREGSLCERNHCLAPPEPAVSAQAELLEGPTYMRKGLEDWLKKAIKKRTSIGRVRSVEDTRKCPIRVFEAHEIQDDEWAQDDDRDKEQQLRWERNEVCRALLQDKKSVQFRSSGNSLWPFVQSGDCCMFKPVDPRFLIVGDVVFCKVQRGDRQYYYAHKILRIQSYQLTSAESACFDGHTHRRVFLIGNQSGRLHGWCFVEQIYGKLKFSPHQRDERPIADIGELLWMIEKFW